MAKVKRVGNENYYWYFNELACRVVAESGRPSDRLHIGKIILKSLKDAPDFILQIDAATGLKISSKEMLQRSVDCATSLRNLGLGVGDCMVIMAPNHIDICVPVYAAFYLGMMVACIDRKLGPGELQHSFQTCKPKVIFCQDEKTSDIENALHRERIDAKILAFNKQDSYITFIENGYKKIDEFKANDFDPKETIATLIPTSGTTGPPKCAALPHGFWLNKCPHFISMYEDFPSPTRLALVVSPLQWITALCAYLLSPITHFTTVSSSSEITVNHILEIITEYKPTHALLSPTLAVTLARSVDGDMKGNLRHLEVIILGGSAVTAEIIKEFKAIAPITQIISMYAMTEIGITMVNSNASDGQFVYPTGCNKKKLVNPSTGKEVTEPDETGELWVKGTNNFKEYYNDPAQTKEAYSTDGWFKTGDLFYMDDKQKFYYVDRLKILLKYKNNHVSPVELESVIRQHPSVMDVAVTGIPDVECGDLPVAVVVRRKGAQVTAQEIKVLVRESLTDTKQLHGGVYFVESLPVTSTSKVDRTKLKEIAISLSKGSKGK